MVVKDDLVVHIVFLFALMQVKVLDTSVRDSQKVVYWLNVTLVELNILNDKCRGEQALPKEVSDLFIL